MLHHRIDLLICPWCSVHHDCASEVTGESSPPEDGNINICFDCTGLSLYDSTVHGGLRKMTPEEQRQATADPDVRSAITAVRIVSGFKQRSN